MTFNRSVAKCYQMIENFLFDVNQNLYLIFIVLSVNGSYDPRNTMTRMNQEKKRVSSWACWLKCGNDFFHPFLLFLLIYCCVAIQLCCIRNSKWSHYVTLADAYYTAIDCLDGNNQKAMVTHNERWLHHMQFIETEWVQREKKKRARARYMWWVNGNYDPNDVQCSQWMNESYPFYIAWQANQNRTH